VNCGINYEDFHYLLFFIQNKVLYLYFKFNYFDGKSEN
jgi:hypothetical protein